MTKRNFTLTAAVIFAASSVTSIAHAENVKCGGVNACKGQSACKTETSAGKGQNSCKGKGFVEVSDAAACNLKRGKVL